MRLCCWCCGVNVLCGIGLWVAVLCLSYIFRALPIVSAVRLFAIAAFGEQVLVAAIACFMQTRTVLADWGEAALGGDVAKHATVASGPEG